MVRGTDGQQMLRDFGELWSTFFCDRDTMRRLAPVFTDALVPASLSIFSQSTAKKKHFFFVLRVYYREL